MRGVRGVGGSSISLIVLALSVCACVKLARGFMGGRGRGGLVGGSYVVGERGKDDWNATEGGMYEARLGMCNVCPDERPVGVGLELGG